MVAELIDKYLWLIRLLTQKGERGLSLEQIASLYEERYGEAYPRRTFNNHRESIEEIFGVPIACNRSTHRYYIPFAEDAVDSDGTLRWMVNTFTVDSLLQMGKKNLTGRIAVEDIPSGHKYLTILMQAMLDGKKVQIEYRKYSREKGESLTIRPYALKEFARRWYVVAWCEQRDGLRVYGLDRIRSLDVLDEDFTLPKGFDVDELFRSSYGIYLPDGKEAETIFLRTAPGQEAFLNDLPLHPSQRAVGHDGKGQVFRLRLIPNDHFIMDLCALGGRIEVLSPESVRERVAREHRNALKYYENTI